jgi:NTE family protein
MLRALYERGLRPDLLVGTSAGAMNAAFAATRGPTVDAAAELETVWRGLTRWRVFPPDPLAAGLGLLGARCHAVPSGSLRRLVTDHLEIDRLEDAPVALHVVTTDVLSGEEVLLSEGCAVDAVLASAAIPGVFAPVEVNGRLLMDGGVTNNTPISHAVALGADRVIVLPAMGAERLTRPPRGAIGATVSAMCRAIGRRLAEDLERYGDLVELTVLPSPHRCVIQPTDFSRADELIAEALHDARRTLTRHRFTAPQARAA